MGAQGRVCLALFAAALAAPATVAPAATASPGLDGKLVAPPAAAAGSVELTLLPAGASRLARVRLPRRALRRPARLRLGDRLRVRARPARARVLRRGAAPSFARLDALTAQARSSAAEAASALARISTLPTNIIGTDNLVAADDARQLRERLNLVDERLIRLAGSLERAEKSVRRAFGRRADRLPGLRRLRRRAASPLRGRIAALRAASPTLQEGVFELDKRLSLLPKGPLELPIGTVGTLTEVIQDLLALLEALSGR